MADAPDRDFQLQCPVASDTSERIVLAHGGGGRMSERLFEQVFLPAFSNTPLATRHDGALLDCNGGKLAFSTDSYVVRPLFFPGGNIGDLAVNGTVNDLAMCGARPLWLSAGFILEEGLPLETLRTVVYSMARAAAEAGVQIVTGDTKVVERGRADGMYVTTSGVGVVEGNPISPSGVQPGDAIVVSGDLGAHGIAVLSVREGLEFDAPVVTDCAPLWEPVKALFDAGLEIHCLRDLTRGGLSSALNEIAKARGVQMEVEEGRIPIQPAVRGACELLGLDPLYVANEGRFCVFLPEEQAPRAVEALKGLAQSKGAVAVGRVGPEGRPQVTLRSTIGGRRVLDMLSGEQLPRIC